MHGNKNAGQQIGHATRFQKGHKPSERRLIGVRRLRQLMAGSLPEDMRDILTVRREQLEPLLAATALRRMMGDPSVTQDQRDMCDRLMDVLWPRLAVSPPPAPAALTPEEKAAALQQWLTSGKDESK